MAFRQSRQILAGYPVLTPDGAEDGVVITADFLVPSGGLAAGDIIEMCGLDSGLVPVRATLVAEDCDTGATLTIDCGVLSGPYGALLNSDGSARTIGSEFFAASTVAQAGGIQEANKAAGFLLAPSADLVSIGLKIVAAPAGQVVGARLRLNVVAHAMPVSV